jgi:hypothetical protein
MLQANNIFTARLSGVCVLEHLSTIRIGWTLGLAGALSGTYVVTQDSCWLSRLSSLGLVLWIHHCEE